MWRLLALLVAASVGAALLSCSEGPSEVEGPAGTRLAVAAEFPDAAANGASAAFSKVDAVQLRLVRESTGEAVLEEVRSLEGSGGAIELRLEVSLREEREAFRLELELRRGEDALFRASRSVELAAGEAPTVELELVPVPASLSLPDEPIRFRALEETRRVEAAVRFATGDPIESLSPSWSSQDTEVVTAAEGGRLTSKGEGRTRVTASLQDLSDGADVEVSADVDEVAVEPGSATVFLEGTQQFSATALGPNGNELDRTFAWSSSRPEVAPVDEEGRATGRGPGETTITAEAGGGTGSAELTVGNRPPEVEISAPEAGAIFDEGESVRFEGTATDPAEGQLPDEALVWTSSKDDQLGTGRMLTRSDLTPGLHDVKLTATDSHGKEGSAAVSIRVGGPPKVEISRPGSGDTFEEGESVPFEGEAEDPTEGKLPEDALEWTSSLDGGLGTGASFTRVAGEELSGGDHEVTLEATDDDGNTASSTVSITVGGPPEAEISSPPDGESFALGEEVDFQGEGTDPVQGELPPDALVWTSNRESRIGIGKNFTLVAGEGLSQGSHQVTLEVTDNRGNTATDRVSIDIGLTATITSPGNESSFEEGATVRFEGEANAPGEGELTGDALVWTSNRNGEVGTGQSFTRTAGKQLSPGRHEISLQATDSEGNTASASVFTTIGGPPKVVISSPTEGTGFDEGETVLLEGSARDPIDGVLSGDALVWTSDLESPIGRGQRVELTAGEELRGGRHEIKLTATDSRGSEGTASVSIRVDGPPTATISAPPDEQEFEEGEDIDFRGSGTDPLEGELTGDALQWSSDQESPVGQGQNFTLVAGEGLRVATHRITLTVTDGDGNQDTDQRTITVEGVPAVTITSPGAGSRFFENEAVSLEGSATDEEDGRIAGRSLVWRSSIDGRLGTGESLSLTNLSAGTHDLTLTATDSDGHSRSATVTIEVERPELSTIDFESLTVDSSYGGTLDREGATFSTGTLSNRLEIVFTDDITSTKALCPRDVSQESCSAYLDVEYDELSDDLGFLVYDDFEPGTPATVTVFRNGTTLGTVDVTVDGDPDNGDAVDLSNFENVTRIRIDIDAGVGLLFDDFSFRQPP